MNDCRYMVEGACTNRLALPVYGARPSEGVCAQCRYRHGIAGLGDVVALIISFTPLRRMQGKCAPCKDRQEAMNQAMPMRRCQCKGRDGLNAPKPADDERKEV